MEAVLREAASVEGFGAEEGDGRDVLEDGVVGNAVGVVEARDQAGEVVGREVVEVEGDLESRISGFADAVEGGPHRSQRVLAVAAAEVGQAHLALEARGEDLA